MVYVFSGSIYECLGLEIYFPNGSGLLLLYLMPLLPPEFNIYISFTLRIVMTEIVGCIYIASYSKYSSWTFFTLKVHLLITRTLQCHALCLSTLISCQVCYFKHMCIELTRQGFGKEGLQQCPQWAELSRAPCQSRAALAAPKGPPLSELSLEQCWVYYGRADLRKGQLTPVALNLSDGEVLQVLPEHQTLGSAHKTQNVVATRMPRESGEVLTWAAQRGHGCPVPGGV